MNRASPDSRADLCHENLHLPLTGHLNVRQVHINIKSVILVNCTLSKF